ncbi:hypothetical protein [Magnetospirillum sp. SS-4]|uniref:hypothetical protein n=1 Tax=Magnetospirillum sp. SS-4 TaxID=2681465 RepID=UPI00138140F0|nr:hypothetical protein [Magnetospirillum sp. SS-4]CAA7627369.1 conserved hypothetical protein [Magnetospirillum sp. SS-4]
MTTLSVAQGGVLPRDHLEAIRRVLRTQVSDILHLNVTQLSALTPDRVYDQVLDTPALLHECFQVFRSQPGLFNRVVVRQDKRPPASDQDALWCGRSLADVVAMIVRASAKRYFRATLPQAPRPAPAAPVARPGLVRQAAIGLGLMKPPPPPRQPAAPLGQGDKLYRAFRSNLLYEWQVPLIPHYAPLEIRTVTRLGARILDLREPGQIQILAAEGLTAEGRLPLVLDDARRLRGPDGGIDANALSEAFVKLGLEAVFPNLEDAQLRRAVSQISCMEAKAVELLIPALETDLRAVAVFLFSCFSSLGEKGFRQAFGACGAMWAIQKLAKHLEGCRPWPRSLPSMKGASDRALAAAIDLATGQPAKDKQKTAPAPAAVSGGGPARAARTPVSA